MPLSAAMLWLSQWNNLHSHSACEPHRRTGFGTFRMSRPCRHEDWTNTEHGENWEVELSQNRHSATTCAVPRPPWKALFPAAPHVLEAPASPPSPATYQHELRGLLRVWPCMNVTQPAAPDSSCNSHSEQTTSQRAASASSSHSSSPSSQSSGPSWHSTLDKSGDSTSKRNAAMKHEGCPEQGSSSSSLRNARPLHLHPTLPPPLPTPVVHPGVSYWISWAVPQASASLP